MALQIGGESDSRRRELLKTNDKRACWAKAGGKATAAVHIRLRNYVHQRDVLSTSADVESETLWYLCLRERCIFGMSYLLYLRV